MSDLYIHEYLLCINDLIAHKSVQTMRNYTQHGDTNCLAHSLYVSYYSYLISIKLQSFLKVDPRSIARGALLHDFFLYDWHEKSNRKGLHGFTHPKTALENASLHFELNAIEKDIIVKHMWPLTPIPPKFFASFLVSMVDKYISTLEIFSIYPSKKNLISTFVPCSSPNSL